MIDLHRRQIAYEHGRLYDALERAAQLAELAGHDDLAAELRGHRRAVSAEISDADCIERPRPLDRAEGDALTHRVLADEDDGA